MNWQATKRATKNPRSATKVQPRSPAPEGEGVRAKRSSRMAEQAPHLGLARNSRKRAPEARARDRVLAILDKATALVAMADDHGALFYVNPAGRETLGLTREGDLSGIALIECVAADDRARIAGAAIPAAISSGFWFGDCGLVAREGREIRVSLLLTAHRSSKGRLEGLSLLAQDMSKWTSTTAAMRITQNELLRLSAQHMTIQENERRRIASDLHDGLGQSLGLVIASLENMAELLSQGEPGKAAECLQRLNPKVRDTLDELRSIAMNLRPATLDSLGILATLSWHLREIEVACPGITIERRLEIDESDVPNCLRTPIFRILQEAGSNAIRHGGADRVTVRLNKVRGVLQLAIEDNGKGFDPHAATGGKKPNRGIGLQSMRERAELSCGIFEISSAPGKGTRIRVKWPASLSDAGLERAAALEPEARAIQSLHFSEPENSRDMEMLHNLSVCVACIRSIKSNG
jgi:two-component system NarL family sensor kinase